MLDELIKMSKNGMFDIAFLLASKYNLENELFNTLKGNYDLSFEELKHYITLKNKTNIKYLDICYNLIEICLRDAVYNNTIDLSNNKKLRHLDMRYNEIKALYLPNTNSLESIVCIRNGIDLINIKNNINIKRLYCDGNNIKILDTYKNINLEVLSIRKNPINKLNLVNNKKLTYLDTEYTFAKEITLSIDVKDKIWLNIDKKTKIKYK